MKHTGLTIALTVILALGFVTCVAGISRKAGEFANLILPPSADIIVPPGTATIGCTSTGPGSYTGLNDRMVGNAYTASGNGAVTTIYAYMRLGSGVHAKAAIYLSSGALISGTQETIGDVVETFTWEAFNFASSVPIVSGNTYVFMVWAGQGGNAHLGDNQPVAIGDYTVLLTYGTFPTQITLESRNTVQFSIYALYQIEGSQPPPTPQVTLIISKVGDGSTTPAVGTYSYDKDSQVQISASPASGNQFCYWLFDNGTQTYVSTTTLTLNQSISAQAVFNVIGLPPPQTNPPANPNESQNNTGNGGNQTTIEETPTPDLSDRVNEAATVGGAATAVLSGMGIVLVNPKWFGKKKW